MGFAELMNKVRQLDNRLAQWMVRHFYILFFEIILVVIFYFAFVSTLKVIDVSADLNKQDVVERLLWAQSLNSLLITFLLLFNSFWMLYIFSTLLRLRSLLRNIDFNLSRKRSDGRRDD